MRTQLGLGLGLGLEVHGTASLSVLGEEKADLTDLKVDLKTDLRDRIDGNEAE